MSILSRIADAVAESLNAGTFAMPFTASKRWHLVHEKGAPKDLSVVVMPAEPKTELASRNARQGRYTILIVVQRKLASRIGPDMESEIQELTDLADAIDRHVYESGWPDSLPGLAWMESVTDPVVSPEHLEKYRSFTSVIAVTFAYGE